MISLLSELNRIEKRHEVMHPTPPILPPNYIHPFVLNIGNVPLTSILAQPLAHNQQSLPLTSGDAEPRSSPLRPEGDDDQNMQDYFNC